MRPSLPALARPALALAALLLAAAPAGAEPTLCGTPWSPAEKAVRRHDPAGRIAVPDFAAVAVVPLAGAPAGSIRRVDLPAGRKLVALTFDLCETPGEVAGFDAEIFETLAAEKVPATLFVGGHWAATHPGRFADLAAAGLFELANHGWSHANLRRPDPARRAHELLAPEAAFAAALDAPQCRMPGAAPAGVRERRPRLFRFPYGACDATSMRDVNQAGFAAIQWDVSTADASPLISADAIVRATLASVRPGSIVLAHANGRGHNTGRALPRLIAALRERGYAFVTVGDLLAAGTPVVAPSCYDARPGDTDRYDRPAAPAAVAIGPARPPAPGAASGQAPR